MTDLAKQIRIASMYGDGSGATLQEIGERFGVSRQRVHQVVSRPKLKEYQRQRREANLRLVTPYSPTQICQRCREPVDPTGGAILCLGCKKKVKVVRLVQHRLRKGLAVKRGRWSIHLWLNQAAYLIRKHNLKPEDFR